MKMSIIQRRTIWLILGLIPLLSLFLYTVFYTGKFAPIVVTTVSVKPQKINSVLFGVGTVEARYIYKTGPTIAGRIKSLAVDVGDHVRKGQLLGEMDPVDLEDRIRSQEANIRRAEAALEEAEVRRKYAYSQAERYERLFKAGSTSEEVRKDKQQALQVADVALVLAREEQIRLSFEREALITQKANLQLIAPVDGLVSVRHAEPGTTVIAGQPVLELIDPSSIWINVRLDQTSAHGVRDKLPAQITLRSRQEEVLSGMVYRVEVLADVVTEELLAKVILNQLPNPLPAIGELAEVTIIMPTLEPVLTIPNSALQRIKNKIGVWKIEYDVLRFTPISVGASDLEGNIQIVKGLSENDQVVVYSEQQLSNRSRIRVQKRMNVEEKKL